MDIKHIISVAVGLCSFATFAQKGGSPLSGTGETVINPKEIKVDTAERIYSQATDYVNNQEEVLEPVTFDFSYKPQVNTQNIKTMVAMYRLKVEKIDESKSGFVRIGVGNYFNTLFDAYYGSRASKQFAWAVNANHLGAVNGPVAKKLSGYSDNRFGLHGKYFLPNYIFNFSANYQRTVSQNYSPAFYKYGFDKKVSELDSYKTISDLVKKNPTNDLFFDLGASSINTKKAFQFDLKSSPYYFTLNDSVSEFKIQNSFTPSYQLKQGKILLHTGFDYTTLNANDTAKINRTAINIAPSFEHKSSDKKLIVEAGLIFNSSNDTTLDKKLSVYPLLKGSYLISKDHDLMVRGQLRGGLTQQTLKSTYRQNVWMGYFNPNTTNDLVAISTSLEAVPVKNLKTKIKFDYRSVKNFGYFSPMKDSSGYFTNSYSKDPVNVINPGFEISYNFLAGHGVKVNFDYYSFSSKDTLLYTPNMITNLEIYFKLNKNIKLSTDISYISGLVGFYNKDMDPIVDLNLKGEYKFNDKIGAFIHANNLVSKKYQYFEGYASQGINIMGGLTVNF